MLGEMELPGDEKCSPTGLQDISVFLASSQCQNLSHHGEGFSRFARVREKLGDVEERSQSTPLIPLVRCKTERTPVGRQRRGELVANPCARHKFSLFDSDLLFFLFQERGDAATGVKPHRRPRGTRDRNPYPFTSD